MPGEGEGDIWVASQAELAPNERCPISFKFLLDLQDPVQDKKGFVYERASILAYIRDKGRNGAVDSPQAGTSHKVAAADLQPATKVIRGKKRAAQMKKAAAGSGPAGEDDDAIIL